jgi:hypothetical protein
MPTDAWRYELGTKGSVVELGLAAHDAGMLKRVLAALLWFYAGWYGGALLADFLGVSQLLGPIIGATSAALVVGDPRRIIWTARSAGNPPSSQEPAVDPV